MTLTSFVSLPEFVSCLANPLLGNLRRAVNISNTNFDSSNLPVYEKVCLTQIWYIYKKNYCNEKIMTQLKSHESSGSQTKNDCRPSAFNVKSSSSLNIFLLHVWWHVFYLLTQVPINPRELNLDQLLCPLLLLFLFHILQNEPLNYPPTATTHRVLPHKGMITGALTLKKLPFLSCFMGWVMVRVHMLSSVWSCWRKEDITRNTSLSFTQDYKSCGRVQKHPVAVCGKLHPQICRDLVVVVQMLVFSDYFDRAVVLHKGSCKHPWHFHTA